MSLKQPGRHERLTSYAIIRLKLQGKRFEIACFKDKVFDWRRGLEQDLDDVVAVDTIFKDASKGICAGEGTLRKAFGTTDPRHIARIILKQGRQQLSVNERETLLQSLFRTVIQFAVERCIHPRTGRPLPASIVESSLRKIGFSVLMEQSAKVQGLRAVEVLCKTFPADFGRAKLRARVTSPPLTLIKLRDDLISRFEAQVENEDTNDERSDFSSLTFSCDPCYYRAIDELVSTAYGDHSVMLHFTSAALANDSTLYQGMCAAEDDSMGAFAHEPFTETIRIASSTGCLVVDSQRGAALSCSTCKDMFEDLLSFRVHCRSDWHNFNLRLKVAERMPISRHEFEECWAGKGRT